MDLGRRGFTCLSGPRAPSPAALEWRRRPLGLAPRPIPTPDRGYLQRVADLDPRLLRALLVQLEGRRELLRAGARPVGWKLGTGERERIGAGPVVGYLTSASQLPNGGMYRMTADALLHADAEVALELGIDGEIAGFGAALELVDLGGSDDAQQIVADNVFHRAAVFGPVGPTGPARPMARLIVNGEVRAQARAPSSDYPRVVHEVGRLLAVVG